MAASLFFSAPKLESVSTADTSDSFLLVNLSPFAAVISKVSPRTTISFTFPEFILATASEREMSWLFDTGLKATTKAAAIIKTKKTIPIYFPSCLTIVETYLNTKNSLLQGYFKNVKILLHRAFYIFNLGLGFQVFQSLFHELGGVVLLISFQCLPVPILFFDESLDFGRDLVKFFVFGFKGGQKRIY